jgi:hypothetical protein
MRNRSTLTNNTNLIYKLMGKGYKSFEVTFEIKKERKGLFKYLETKNLLKPVFVQVKLFLEDESLNNYISLSENNHFFSLHNIEVKGI